MTTMKLTIAALAIVAATTTSAYAAGNGAHQNDQSTAATTATYPADQAQSDRAQPSDGGTGATAFYPSAAANEDSLLTSRAAIDARSQ